MTSPSTLTDYSEVLKKNKIVGRNVLAFTIDEFLSKQECQELIDLTEKKGYETALVNVGNGKQILSSHRQSDRCIIDDSDMAKRFFKKVKDFLPQEINGHKVLGLNERMRFLRYDKGDYFKPHLDGNYVRDNDPTEKSTVTFFLFLNEEFSGGACTFVHYDDETKNVPCPAKTGRLLVFEHRIYHEGSLLVEGRKYAVRSDVMYKKKKTFF